MREPRGAPVLRIVLSCLVREAVNATEADYLHNGDDESTKFAHYCALKRCDGMPAYLRYRRSATFSFGRSVKTRLRCDTHDLQIDAGRRGGVPRPRRLCECCPLGESHNLVEDARHFMFDCALYDDIRLNMYDKIDEITMRFDHVGWRRMSWAQKFRFLLGDGPNPDSTPDVWRQWSAIEVTFYFYLANAWNRRQRLRD